MSDINIPGVGPVHTSGESTTTNVKEDYLKWMNIINGIFDKDESEWTEADYNQLLQAVQMLEKLAKEGDKSSGGSTDYLTTDMAQKLKSVLELLSTVGITADSKNSPSQGLIEMKTLAAWKSDTGIDFSMVLANAAGVENADQTMQMAVYNFVINGLDAYNKALEQLAEKLQINLDIANTLALLQELRNGKVTTPDGVPWDPQNKPGTVTPVVNLTDEDIKNLVIYRQKLQNELNALDPNGTDRLDPTTLAGSIQKVLDGINASGPFTSADSLYGGKLPDFSQWTEEDWEGSDYFDEFKKSGGMDKAKDWFLDGLDQIGGKAGQYQDDLTNATTQCSNINESQKEEFRQLQTTSSQITDMASVLINAINDIIKKFAKGSSG